MLIRVNYGVEMVMMVVVGMCFNIWHLLDQE